MQAPANPLSRHSNRSPKARDKKKCDRTFFCRAGFWEGGGEFSRRMREGWPGKRRSGGRSRGGSQQPKGRSTVARSNPAAPSSPVGQPMGGLGGDGKHLSIVLPATSSDNISSCNPAPCARCCIAARG